MDKKNVLRLISALLLLSLVAGICLMATACSDETDNPGGTGDGNYTLSLDQTSLTLVEDQKATIVATVTPEGKISWNSSDPAVVSVSNGELLAKAVGTATITATVGSVSKTCTVTVAAGDSSFRFLQSEQTYYAVERGSEGVAPSFGLYTMAPDGTKTPEDGGQVAYEIENTKIAELKDGKIVGKMGGVTVIKATCGDYTASAEVRVYDKFISTANQWCEMLASRTLGEYYLLTADIDFAGVNYRGTYKGAPGSNAKNAFRSVLDGNGHTVKNIRITGSGSEYVSIFGQLYGAKIRDIHFENVVISADGYACGLATCISNLSSVVENVSLDLTFEKAPAAGSVLVGETYGGVLKSIIATVKTPHHNAANDHVAAINNLTNLNVSAVYVLAEGAIADCGAVATYTSQMDMVWAVNAERLLPASSWNYVGGAQLPALIKK